MSDSATPWTIDGGFPGGSAVKNLPAVQETEEMWVQTVGWEDSPGGGNGNPLQCSCLGNPMNRGAWQAIVHRVAESQTQLKRLSTHAQTVNHQAPLSMEFFQARNTRVGSHSFLQGIFPTQGSNLHLLHWQVDSLPLGFTREAQKSTRTWKILN